MRLGLDIGTNSIGWWLYATENDGIVEVRDGGVRIFPDGRDSKSGASLAVDRRNARAQRRRRDRFLRRKAALMRRMAKAGLMPANPSEAKTLESLDPYALRAEGLGRELPLTHFGRALFHLNQRRGFKSNRKTDRGDNESGKIRDATARLDQEMMARGARTYGEFLHMRRAKAMSPREVPTVRTRLSVARRDNAEKAEAGYDFYPDRRHLDEEFGKLWAAQAKHNPEVLTDNLRDAIREIIFHQRPLKTPAVGLCLFTDEDRIPSAHPLNQRRILFETVNHLKVAEYGKPARSLTREERDRIVHALDNKKHTKQLSGMLLKLKALGKVIRLRPEQFFTLETANRDKIDCDPVRASLSHPDRFGPRWSTLDEDAQWDVIERIRNVQSEKDHDDLVAWLKATHDCDHAKAVANAPLRQGYGRLGLTATQRILAALKSDVIPYSKAVEACGWHHSDGRTGEPLAQLPYYGQILNRHVIPGTYDEADDDITRYGRITNPTVHIGLNQLRRLVNRIITVHGMPDDIVVELARDLKRLLLSAKRKQDVQRDIKKNTDAAIARGGKLEKLERRNTGANRMRLRLWESLGDDVMTRNCPYSGRRICVSMIFDSSCDVDHILPYARTLDNSFANRTLCLKEFNRQKADKTPWEAWGDTPQWDTIVANLRNLPKNNKGNLTSEAENKARRFEPDAMERFEGENDFSARALKDTQYLSRIARTYLDALYDGSDGKSHVRVVPGRLTEMLRRHWGLNSLLPDHNQGTVKAKNRTDHRHHAIDAAVVAATDRSLIKRISDRAKRDEENGAEEIARDTDPPWDGFRADIGIQLDRIIVSHRADHGRIDREGRKKGRDSTTGQLHNDTAYGIVDDQTVVSRTPLLSLKPGDIEETQKGKNIRDPYLQKALAVATQGKDGKAFEQALRDFAVKDGPYQGIRRVRLIESLQSSARVEIPDAKGKPVKAYKGDSNHCYELWRLPDGKVKPQVITTFEAHQPDCLRKPHPAAKRILRVFKRDMVALEKDGQTVICYVQKMGLGKGLVLAPHLESNADARQRDKADPFRFTVKSAHQLDKANARRIYVDEMGRLRDPGPPGR